MWTGMLTATLGRQSTRFATHVILTVGFFIPSFFIIVFLVLQTLLQVVTAGGTKSRPIDTSVAMGTKSKKFIRVHQWLMSSSHVVVSAAVIVISPSPPSLLRSVPPSLLSPLHTLSLSSPALAVPTTTTSPSYHRFTAKTVGLVSDNMKGNKH